MKQHVKLINNALAAGFVVSVYDGEEWQVKQSTDKAAILAAVDSVEISELIIRDPRDMRESVQQPGRMVARRIGWACIIDEQGENDTIADCSISPEMDALMVAAGGAA